MTPQRELSPLIFFLALLLLNLPNFFLLSVSNSAWLDAAEYIERLVQCLLLAAIGLCLFSRPAAALLVASMLFLWWLPLALAVRVITGAPINATLVGMAVATSPAELQDLLAVVSQRWLALFLLWNVFLWWAWRYLRARPQWRWSWSFRGKVLLFSGAMLVLPFLLALTQGPAAAPVIEVQAELEHKSTDTLTRFTEADKRIGPAEHLPDAFPYELPWAFAQYLHARRVIDEVRASLAAPPPLASLPADKAQAEVVVLVIGESSSRNAWRVFNPQAPATTPALEARLGAGEALFLYPHTLAQTASTRQAVPSLLTAQPLVWPNGKPNPDATHSIVWVAGQAGYATAWLSNQAAVGQHDGIIASYAQEAQAVAFLNPASFSDQGSYDEVLLTALRRQLAAADKLFVVLHTMGSHFAYRHRYPQGHGLYPQASSPQEEYFNTISYTDDFLDKAMLMLAEDGRRSVLIYTSDHGEDIPGESCKKPEGGRNTRDTYEVPALVWLSPSYAQAFPAMVAQLSAQQSQHYDVSAVHSTLLDLMRAEVTTPLAQPSLQSFARPAVQLNAAGEKILPVWTQTFNAALQKNPCFMILK